MTDRFEAARLKIERAKKHIADLNALVLALPDSFVSTIEIDEEHGAQIITYTPVDIEKVAPGMALIIGDAFHNLRVAMEYSYLGAVERLAPSVLDEHTKFPIYETKGALDAALQGRGIDKLSPKFYNRIVSDIRPYRAGGNLFIDSLHDFDVSDKHWLLTPLMQVSYARGIVVKNAEGVTVTGDMYPITGSGPYSVAFSTKDKIEDKGKVFVQITLDIDHPLHCVSVVDCLNDFVKTAGHIVEALASLY